MIFLTIKGLGRGGVSNLFKKSADDKTKDHFLNESTSYIFFQNKEEMKKYHSDVVVLTSFYARKSIPAKIIKY